MIMPNDILFQAATICKSCLEHLGIAAIQCSTTNSYDLLCSPSIGQGRAVEARGTYTSRDRLILWQAYRLNYVAEFAGETGSVQGMNYPLTTRVLCAFKVFITTTCWGLFFHTDKLNCAAAFAEEAGSVQGINYPHTTCVSHLHSNGLEHKLVALVGTVSEWL